MKKVLKGVGIASGIIVCSMILVYFLIGLYYMNGFPCFTWINGVYCTGKTVQEVNNELIQNDYYSGIAVLGKQGEKLFVRSEDVDLRIDYSDAVNRVYQTGNPFMWGKNLFDNGDYRYEPSVTMNREKLSDIISGWEIFSDPNDFRCRLVKTDTDGYIIQDEFVTLPDSEKTISLVYDLMLRRESVADLSIHEECYRTYDLRSKARDELELYNKISPLQNISLTYKIGSDEVVFSRGEICDAILTTGDYDLAVEEKNDKKVLGAGRFIINGQESQLPEKDKIRIIEGVVTDENGYPIISEKKLYAFLEDLVERYDTRNLMDEYRSGNANTIVINKNSRGNGTIIDISSEFDYLKEMVLQGEDKEVSDVRELALSDNIIVVDASEQLGDTYIEIDMGRQELNYYVDGKLDMSFPIVTGNINRGRGTPTGIFNIYNKRYHTYLRGADYVSYVNYWLGVIKGIGIHDATWRSKFGEERYKSEGSHGCINCPLDQAEILWEKVEVGTPAILYY